jgi:small subunit ribosomal protein S21
VVDDAAASDYRQRPRIDAGSQIEPIGGARPLKIDVVDNQIESALKALKKQMVKEGLFKDMKRREYYEKPSVKRKRKQAAARKKRLKALKRSQGDQD